MKKPLSFALLLVLSVAIVVTGLAWAQKQVIEPLQPAQIASLNQIVEMIVQGKPSREIEMFWRQILVANPRMDPQAAINYINTQARQKLEGNIANVRSQLKARENLKQKLNTTGDDAQLANIDLQNQLQKQQQLLNMLSAISKMLEDSSTSVIRKIGG
jgi:hypothetical protein